MKTKIKVAITMGDPSGVGPSVIAKALPKVKGLAEFIIIGDKQVFNKIHNAQYAIRNTQYEIRHTQPALRLPACQ